jgi:hypothetical protein
MSGNGMADIEGRVQELISADDEGRKWGMSVMQGLTRVDDDWTYMVVGPTKGGGFWASDYARILEHLEKLVRKRIDAKLILLPVADAD